MGSSKELESARRMGGGGEYRKERRKKQKKISNPKFFPANVTDEAPRMGDAGERGD